MFCSANTVCGSVCRGSGAQEPDSLRKSMARGRDERPRAEHQCKTTVSTRPVRGFATFTNNEITENLSFYLPCTRFGRFYLPGSADCFFPPSLLLRDEGAGASLACQTMLIGLMFSISFEDLAGSFWEALGAHGKLRETFS